MRIEIKTLRMAVHPRGELLPNALEQTVFKTLSHTSDAWRHLPETQINFMGEKLGE